MPRIAKTIFRLEVTDKEYLVSYSGTLKCPETREDRKHNERLMRALLANNDLLTFLCNIVNPVVRCKCREARKAAKNEVKS